MKDIQLLTPDNFNKIENDRFERGHEHEFVIADYYGRVICSRDNGGHWNCQVHSPEGCFTLEKVSDIKALKREITKNLFPEIKEVEIPNEMEVLLKHN